MCRYRHAVTSCRCSIDLELKCALSQNDARIHRAASTYGLGFSRSSSTYRSPQLAPAVLVPGPNYEEAIGSCPRHARQNAQLRSRLRASPGLRMVQRCCVISRQNSTYPAFFSLSFRGTGLALSRFGFEMSPGQEASFDDQRFHSQNPEDLILTMESRRRD